MFQLYRSLKDNARERLKNRTRKFSLVGSLYARRLLVEELEDRRMLAVLTVHNNLDDSLANLAGDGELSLREAIELANNQGVVVDGFSSNDVEDEIAFDAAVFAGDSSSVIRLVDGQLSVSESIVINGSAATDVVITGDTLGNDSLANNSFATDIAQSLIDDPSSLDDNTRVINFWTDTGDLTITDVTITGGRTTGHNGSFSSNSQSGGGIRFNSAGTLTLTSSSVIGNSTTGARADGGGIFAESGIFAIIDSIVSGNSTLSADGGGIAMRSGELEINNSTVSANSSGDDGAGVHSHLSVVTLNKSTVSGNISTGVRGSGGGININSGIGTVTLIDSTVQENRSVYGGGISSGSRDVTLIRSTVSGNSSEKNGGGIRTSGGAVTLISSTVSGNNTDGSGGGLYTSAVAVTITDSTVSENVASKRGGGAYVSDSFVTSTFTISNSILAGNLDSGDAPDLRTDPDSIVKVDYSLIGDTTRSGVDELTGVGNLLNVDPRLGPLSDNGGPTLTHALLDGSPALDKGLSMLPTDQRGAARTVDFMSFPNANGGNGADIGAFERQTISPYLPSNVTVFTETLSDVDLSATRIVNESDTTLNVTLRVSAGAFATPADGSWVGAGVTATLVEPQLVSLQGTAHDINSYLDNPSRLRYTASASAVGVNAAAIAVTVESKQVGTVQIDIAELPSLIVTTASDLVDPFDQRTSLREATIFANSTPGADAIRFDASVFTGGAASLIRLAGNELQITDSLTIDGSAGVGVTITGDTDNDDITDAANVTNVEASFSGTPNTPSDLLDDNTRVINFSADTGDLTLSNLTITGGRTTGDQSGFAGSSSQTFSGGGIRFLSEGSLVLADTTVGGNSTAGSHATGGGIFVNGDALTITDSTIAGNRTAGDRAYGGGIHVPFADVTLTGSTVSGNSTLGTRASGGAIYAKQGSFFLASSIVSRNSTAAYRARGGAIYLRDGAATISQSTISGNSTSGSLAYASGLFALYGAITVESSTISGNSGASTIRTGDGDVTLTDSAISNNGGRGIFSNWGDVALINSSVSGNISYSSGGGIGTTGGAIRLLGSTVAGNESTFRGGGLRTASGAIELINSTVSRNTSGAGGGISTSHGVLTLISSTVTANIAQGRGGGILVNNSFSTSPLTVVNSIIAGNSDDGTAPDLRPVENSVLTIDYSLIGDTTGSLVDDLTGTGNLLDIDPLLGPLANNGGPTRTHALLPGSPTIDMGDRAIQFDPTEFDQRGTFFHRVVGGRIDIGAVESGATSADFDYDSDIDGSDFLQWQRGFGLPLPVHSKGDANFDGAVDADDLDLWSLAFGKAKASPPTGLLDGNDRQSYEANAASAFTGRYPALIDAAIALITMEEMPTGSPEFVEGTIMLEAASTALNTKVLLLLPGEASDSITAKPPITDHEGYNQLWLDSDLLESVFSHLE